MTSDYEEPSRQVRINGGDIERKTATSNRQVIRSEVQGNMLKEKENQSFSGNDPLNFAARPAGRDRASRAITTGSNMKAVLNMFQYDYYEGLLSTDSGSDECRAGGKVEKEVIRKGCMILRNAGLRQGYSAKTGRSYSRGLNWHQGVETAAVAFLQSGSTTGKTPQLTVKGGNGFAAWFVPMLQKADPNFRAIRVDTCLDLIGEHDADFDSLLEVSSRFAAGSGLGAPDVMGTPEAGRTFYLRGKGGVVLRVYEKGLEQRGKGNVDAPKNWLRAEFQFTGIEAAKKLSIARLSPGELVCHKDFPRQWLERIAPEIGLVERGERAARFVAEYSPKVKTLDDTMQHGARQYGKTFALAGALDIIKNDFSGDRNAAAEAGALEVDRIAERAAELFHDKIMERGAVDTILVETRLDLVEPPEEWACATATRLQEQVVCDLGREVRARRQHDDALRPVTSELVNRAELELSISHAAAALDAVCAAAAGDETLLAKPARNRGRIMSDKHAVVRWDYYAQQRGERLLRALSDLGVPSSEFVKTLDICPAWLPGGLSVGDAVADHKLEPLLHTCLPNLAERLAPRATNS
jgi:hypothetical protein